MPTLSYFFPVLSKFKYLLALSCLVGLLSGCSIETLVAEDAKIENHLYQEEPASDDPVDIFIADCNKCIRGEVSLFPKLVEVYYSSFTPSRNYQPGQFRYQQIEPTQAFEKCAEKAHTEGNTEAFNQLMIRSGRIARTARFFYIQKDYRQGAYWLQRIININGEMDGLQIAGRIFIQDMRTIDIGVRLLEQSARLGNRDARQMLLGLLQPGTSYYQSITRNTLTEDEIGSDEELVASFEAITGQTPPDQEDQTYSSSADSALESQSPESKATASANSQETSTANADSTLKEDTSSQAPTPEYIPESEGQVKNLPISEQKRAEQTERIKNMRAKADAAAKAAQE